MLRYEWLISGKNRRDFPVERAGGESGECVQYEASMNPGWEEVPF